MQCFNRRCTRRTDWLSKTICCLLLFPSAMSRTSAMTDGLWTPTAISRLDLQHLKYVGGEEVLLVLQNAMQISIY